MTTWNDVDRALPRLHSAALRAGWPYTDGDLTVEPGDPAELRWTGTLDVHAPVPGGHLLARTPADCLAIIAARTAIYDDLAAAIEAAEASTFARLHRFPGRR